MKQEQQVLRNVFKICKKYLTHIQNSTFGRRVNCKFTKEIAQYELNEWIRKDRDSLIVFKNRESKWLNKEFWGIKDDKTSNFL